MAYSSLLPTCSPSCTAELPGDYFLQLVLQFLWKIPSSRAVFAVGSLTPVAGRVVTERLRLAGPSAGHLEQPAGLGAVSPFLQPAELPPCGSAAIWSIHSFSWFCIISKLAEKGIPLPSGQSFCFSGGCIFLPAHFKLAWYTCSKLLRDTKAAALCLLDLKFQVHTAQFCPRKHDVNFCYLLGTQISFSFRVKRTAKGLYILTVQQRKVAAVVTRADPDGAQTRLWRFLAPGPGQTVQVQAFALSGGCVLFCCLRGCRSFICMCPALLSSNQMTSVSLILI